MNETISTISLLLALLAILSGVFYPRINKILKENKPGKGKKLDRKNYKWRIRGVITFHCLPLLISYIFLFYVCLPSTIEIRQVSNFDPWNFDVINTIFVFVNILLFIISVFYLVTLGRLIHCLYK